jgi:hypothetical protein
LAFFFVLRAPPYAGFAGLVIALEYAFFFGMVIPLSVWFAPSKFPPAAPG